MQAALSLFGRGGLRSWRPQGRATLLWLVAAAYIAISFATRLALIARALAVEELGWSEIPRVLAAGFAYDAVTSLYLVAPLALYLTLVPRKRLSARTHRTLMLVACALAFSTLAYVGMVEYFFFDEFNARFNFVAVEYLIYPHEVFVNIWDSYPVARAVLAAMAIGAAAAWLMRPAVRSLSHARETPRAFHPHVAVLFLALVIAHVAINLDTWRTGVNRVADEIAANGLYSFFNAALNSRLDYEAYYLTVARAEAVARVRRIVAQDNARFIPGAANPIARRVTYATVPKRLNVIVLVQESLGAEFVGAYGDRRGLTPSIDALARQSILFGSAFATGTRTVRGLEAVTASFPPVPAESIVKRSRNEGMFNWSTVMREAGYQPTFIYGGYGTFDNMNHFFRHNGYRVVDRTDIADPRFSNIWGVSDEDLLRHALAVYDDQHARGERIFSVVMSTSNHKPFTFPAGVPGVPENGGGREAGVRYADYAIGRFIEALRAKPYFRDTAVVIVADHGARVYGKEDFPLHSYRIPFLVYAPHHFAPREVDADVSQLDVAPTVLGLLGISHDSAFFGRDVLAPARTQRSVPLNHNRDIALMAGNRLNELGFRKTSSTRAADRISGEQRPVPRDEEGIRDAASVFQIAYGLYAGGRYAAR
jgi:phosphoglycerol transferase MdoB-like AlkP superfamily enzyme